MKDTCTYVSVRALYPMSSALRSSFKERAVAVGGHVESPLKNAALRFILSTGMTCMDDIILPTGLAMSTAYVLGFSVP
jgi:hypothetical protein